MRRLEAVDKTERAGALSWRCTKCEWSVAIGSIGARYGYAPAIRLAERAFEGHACTPSAPPNRVARQF